MWTGILVSALLKCTPKEQKKIKTKNNSSCTTESKPRVSEPVLLFVQTYYKQRKKIRIESDARRGAPFSTFYDIHVDGEAVGTLWSASYSSFGDDLKFHGEGSYSDKELRWAYECIKQRYEKLMRRLKRWEEIREQRKQEGLRKQLTEKLRKVG